MKSFYESDACKSRKHCTSCRNSKHFRQSVSKIFDVPGVDFPCPFGMDNTQQKMPTIPTMANNLASEVVKIAKGALKDKKVMAPPEEVERRKNICSECALFKNGRCTKCGCIIKAKTPFLRASCPIGRW